MKFAGFIGPSYQLRSVNVDCQRCINLYPEPVESGTGKEGAQYVLSATPGLESLVTVGSGPIRALYTASNGDLFAVSGNTVYKITSSWVSTSLGTITTSTGPVSMADNGIQVMLVDGSATGYSITLATSVLAAIADADFPGADQVTFQDGYFIFNVPGTGQFMITGLNDITVDALDLATSEGNPDDIVSILSVHNELWIFGEDSAEVFYDSGNADFPFERVSGAFVEIGCAAPFSTAKMNNSVFWLGKSDNGSGIVYMAQGYQPQRISTHAVEHAIQGYGDISDAVAYTYQENGHFFYVLNFTSANTTWVYDMTTGFWHERVYSNQGAYERHRANAHTYAYSTHVVGDYDTGKLYRLSSDVYDDDGNEISRRRVSPHSSSEQKRVFYRSFQLDIETGTGLDGTGQGTDPQVMLEFSDDGGHSWSNEKWTSFGKIGQTKSRALWRRLGSARDRVWRVTISDPVKVTIIGADLDVELGAS